MVTKINTGPFLGERHLQVFLLFMAVVTNVVARFNVGISIVAMTAADTQYSGNEKFDWNEKEKSYVLSSFFWGHFLTQFPGGYLCRRFGVKAVLLFSSLGSAVLAILPPFCVSWGGWQSYCIIRIIQGLLQGILFPSVYDHLAAWCPVNERNRLGAFAASGGDFGTLLAMFLSGMIAASSLGWPGISYISGAIGLTWCLFWWIFGSNSPSQSKLISAAELHYIESSIKASKAIIEGNESEIRKVPVPLKAIMTSWPLWALLVARSSQAWGFSTLQAEIPLYLNGVLRMDMKKNAFYSSLPYLTMCVMSVVYLICADVLLNRQILSLSAIRKCFNSLAFWVPAVGLVAVGFIGEEHKTVAIALMTANVGINAGSTVGCALNTIDLSPNHAGIVMGIVNTAASIIPIVTPLVVGVIVTDEHDRSQWQWVFIISAIVFAAGNLFYIVFGSTEVQPWNDENFLTKQETQNEACREEECREKH